MVNTPFCKIIFKTSLFSANCEEFFLSVQTLIMKVSWILVHSEVHDLSALIFLFSRFQHPLSLHSSMGNFGLRLGVGGGGLKR